MCEGIHLDELSAFGGMSSGRTKAFGAMVNELRRTVEPVGTPNGGLGCLDGVGRDARL